MEKESGCNCLRREEGATQLNQLMPVVCLNQELHNLTLTVLACESRLLFGMYVNGKANYDTVGLITGQ